MKRFAYILVIITVLFGIIGATLPAAPAYAASGAVDPKADACAGAGAISGAHGCTAPGGSVSPNSLIQTVVNILSVLVGIVSVIMIIIAGFRFVLSGGDSNATAAARNTILYALIGVVVAFLAPVIVRYVLRLLQ